MITAQEYGKRIETLEWRVDHDINEALARALNAGPGSGRWADLGRVCREIGDLAASLPCSPFHNPFKLNNTVEEFAGGVR